MKPQACFEDETVLRLLRRELSAPARDDADRHMAACDECRGLVADAAKSFFADERSGTTVASSHAAKDQQTLASGQAIGRYVITRRIGAGGGGVVYAAHDPSLQRNVALKLLHDDDAGAPHRNAGLLREARAMAQLSHPNVVSVHDIGTFETQVFIAMELIEGQTLNDWLHEQERPWKEVLDVFVQAGQGLAAAHSVGVVHRDFKPTNVMVGADGRVRVTDFGLAHPLGAEWERMEASGSGSGVEEQFASRAWQKAITLTATGELKGTPAYMAPEQFLSPRSDARADQFSFAVALYEALYGFRPFAALSVEQQARAVLHGQPIPPPRRSAVPAACATVLLRALSSRPEQRFASMDKLLLELQASARGRRRKTGLAVAAGIAMLVVAGGVTFVRLQHSAAASVRASTSASPAPVDTAPPIVTEVPTVAVRTPEPPTTIQPAPAASSVVTTATKITRKAAPKGARPQTRSAASAPPRPYL